MTKFRVWKLGSLEHKIAPTQQAAQKLADILALASDDGTLDIIWGPDLEIEEIGHGDDIEECVVKEILESEDEVTFIAHRVKGKRTTQDKGDVDE